VSCSDDDNLCGLNYCMLVFKTKARYITHPGGHLLCLSPHPQPKTLKVAMLQMCRALVHRPGRSRGTRRRRRLPPVSLTRKSSMHFPLSRRRFPLVQFTYLQISRKYQSVACQLSQSRAGNTNNNRDCPWFECFIKRTIVELASLFHPVIITVCFRCVSLLFFGTVQI
jgi:hypothetical protein